jgi:hypothetical protein
VPARSTVRCPSCDSSTAATERFCRRCGNDLGAAGGLPLLAGREDDAAERTDVLETFGRAAQLDRLDQAGSNEPPARSGRRRLIGALVAVFGLALLAAGGYGGYRAVVEGRTTPPAGNTAPATAASTAPAGAKPSGGSPSAGAPSSSPAPLVVAAPALADRPETAEVVQLFTGYFDAINRRDFAGTQKTLVDRPGLPQTEAEFQDRYRSTHDRDVRILGLKPTEDGGYLTSVSFTSFQNPADAPDHTSACLIWSVTYPLVRVDGTLLIDAIGRSAVTYRRC